MEELKYGLQGDKLIHINDVEKGKACNCVCPNCKTELIARKGDKRVKHFAHYKLADCNHGTETALHLMAKSIIAKSRKVFIPHIPKNEYDFSGQGKLILFEKAELEEQLSNSIRGDVVLYSGNRYINIEIKVTHGVNLRKLVEIFNLGIPTIEIDLSDIISDFTREMIEERIWGGSRTHLIFSPKSKDIFAKWILGEWKKVYNSDYVNDCPLSRTRAYFVDYKNKGGSCECHECYAYADYAKHGDGELLCFGCLDGIDFGEIEKIMLLDREEKHICNVKLLMKDGSVLERNTRT